MTKALKSFREKQLSGKKDLRFFLYYFRADDGRCNTRSFLEAAVLKIRELYGLSCALPQELSDQIQNFGQLLGQVSEKLQPTQGELVFVLDGLDEAVSRGAREIVSLIPFLTEAPGIRWLLAGRENCANPYVDIKGLMQDKGVPLMELGPMAKEEIIALLSESGAKYALFKSSDRERLIELAAARSEGNPLYLQGLLEDLISGRKQMELSSFEDLPKGLEGFFDVNMQRLGVVGQSQEAKAILLTLAWAEAGIAAANPGRRQPGWLRRPARDAGKLASKLKRPSIAASSFQPKVMLPMALRFILFITKACGIICISRKIWPKIIESALKSLAICLFDWSSLQGFTRLYSFNYLGHPLYQLRDS